MGSSSTIRIAIAGVGNCASSLVQGISHYAAHADDHTGLAHAELGGYRITDIDVVAAFDIDARKIGKPLHDAIFAPPNNTTVFCREVKRSNVIVQMGEALDGVAPHMANYPPHQRFEVAKAKSVDVTKTLRDSGAEILVNFLPVGSQKATEFYAQACLDAGRRARQLHSRVHRIGCNVGQALRRARPALRGRRHQGAGRRDDHASHPGETLRRSWGAH
jgi:myo-inositol-1-phosphate synthase